MLVGVVFARRPVLFSGKEGKKGDGGVRKVGTWPDYVSVYYSVGGYAVESGWMGEVD